MCPYPAPVDANVNTGQPFWRLAQVDVEGSRGGDGGVLACAQLHNLASRTQGTLKLPAQVRVPRLLEGYGQVVRVCDAAGTGEDA